MTRRLRAITLADYATLPGACAGCRFWESDRLDRTRCGASPDVAAQELWHHKVVNEWGDCGRVAVEDDEVLGLIRYAPAGYFERLALLPAHPLDPATPFIACLHVASDARHHGLGTVLLREVLRDLKSRGDRVVEAIGAVDPVSDDEIDGSPFIPLEFLLRNGFTIAQDHATHPLLRLELRSLVAWADNLDAVLDSLKFPKRLPHREPAPW